MTHPDPRHLKRVETIQKLFAASFQSQEMTGQSLEVWEHKGQLDPEIAETAQDWPLDKLNKIDLAILRLALYELLISKDAPVKVIVDEAVELAKELGGESSPSFVNGVLGTIIDKHKLAEKKDLPAGRQEKNENA